MKVDSHALARTILELGSEGLRDAETQLNALEHNRSTLERADKAGERSLVEYANDSSRLRAEISRLQAALAEAESAERKHNSAQAAAAALAQQGEADSRSDGQKILIASSTIDGSASIGNPLSQTTEHGTTWLAELSLEIGFLRSMANAAASEISRLSERLQHLGASHLRMEMTKDVGSPQEASLQRVAIEESGRLLGSNTGGPTTVENAGIDTFDDRSGTDDSEADASASSVMLMAERSQDVRENASSRPGTSSPVDSLAATEPLPVDTTSSRLGVRAIAGKSGLGSNLQNEIADSRESAFEPRGLNAESSDRAGSTSARGSVSRAVQGLQACEVEFESERFAAALRPRLANDLFMPSDKARFPLHDWIRAAMVQAGLGTETIARTLETTAEMLRSPAGPGITASSQVPGSGSHDDASPGLAEAQPGDPSRVSQGISPAGAQADRQFYTTMLGPSDLPRDELSRELLVAQKQAVETLKGIARILSKPKGIEYARVAPRGVR